MVPCRRCTINRTSQQTLRNEGPLAFYTGFPTFAIRCVESRGPFAPCCNRMMPCTIHETCPAPTCDTILPLLDSIAPHVVLTLVFADALPKIQKEYGEAKHTLMHGNARTGSG